MKLLVTGGAGFIGSNFILYYLKAHPEDRIYNIDKLTYAGNLANLEELPEDAKYAFIHGDICDRDFVRSVIHDHKIEGIVHFAAESHVDNSIHSPDVFIQTNVLGSFNLINEAKNLWMEGPFKFSDQYRHSRFHHVSTDEVYGTLGEEGFFTEETPYAPNSPYSASKAGSDMIIRSYHHTYGMNTVITNCSNNFGPKQHDEKLIPTIIRNAINLKPIPIYGQGLNTRDWLFVEDHCKCIDLVFQKGESGETYNIGCRNEYRNIDLATKICEILDKSHSRHDRKSYKDLISYVTDRPGHDFRYAIDPTKLESELGWRNTIPFDETLRLTVEWYAAKYLAKDASL